VLSDTLLAVLTAAEEEGVELALREDGSPCCRGEPSEGLLSLLRLHRGEVIEHLSLPVEWFWPDGSRKHGTAGIRPEGATWWRYADEPDWRAVQP
jgi:hypothetical protein